MWQIYGQEHIIRQLDAAIRADRLSHAYLLAGPPHVGKMALAIGMAQAVNCLSNGRQATRRPTPPPQTSAEPEPAAGLFGFDDPVPEAASPRLLDGPEPYGGAQWDGAATETADVPCGQCPQCHRVAQGIHPDIRIIGLGAGEEDGASRRDIRIEQVREIESFLNLTPYEGVCKVVIVDGAELMNTAAANALLKTLEEPPPDSLLLLLDRQRGCPAAHHPLPLQRPLPETGSQVRSPGTADPGLWRRLRAGRAGGPPLPGLLRPRRQRPA